MSFEEMIKKIILDAFNEAVHKILENLKLEVYPNVMNVKQVAKYLGVGVNWIYDNIDQLPHFDVGGYKFNKEDIDNWRLDKTGRSFRVVRK
ncbi:MAG: helix-turn-helix domain-containing protein [Clostridiales bacterium]|uniref:helix-turn-helix domain-containing protein n=1 Tax=Zhenhengia sp. TaxID=2944208 RepID=UPI00290DC914|nr:helix-turn-helix domain-containing protein [Clostridiales bacterium]